MVLVRRHQLELRRGAAVTFLVRVKEALEDPARLVLDI
jgi:hypothetical protein